MARSSSQKASRQPAPAHGWEQGEFSFTPASRKGSLPDEQPLLEKVQVLLRRAGAAPLAEKVCVVWNRRLRTTAGMADIRRHTVELNPRLTELPVQHLQRTLCHEAAHLLAHWRVGRKRIDSHGAEWRQACCDLGIPGESAYHDLPWQRKKLTRKFAYMCPHCRFVALRVKPFARFTACYRCCRKWSGGVYDARFQFVRIAMPER